MGRKRGSKDVIIHYFMHSFWEWVMFHHILKILVDDLLLDLHDRIHRGVGAGPRPLAPGKGAPQHPEGLQLVLEPGPEAASRVRTRRLGLELPHLALQPGREGGGVRGAAGGLEEGKAAGDGGAGKAGHRGGEGRRASGHRIQPGEEALAAAEGGEEAGAGHRLERVGAEGGPGH
jgi:hypothetical protein